MLGNDNHSSAFVGGPSLGFSTTQSNFLLMQGFCEGGSVREITKYKEHKKPIAPAVMPKALDESMCWASKSRASSGATPSSKTRSLFSTSCAWELGFAPEVRFDRRGEENNGSAGVWLRRRKALGWRHSALLGSAWLCKTPENPPQLWHGYPILSPTHDLRLAVKAVIPWDELRAAIDPRWIALLWPDRVEFLKNCGAPQSSLPNLRRTFESKPFRRNQSSWHQDKDGNIGCQRNVEFCPSTDIYE